MMMPLTVVSSVFVLLAVYIPSKVVGEADYQQMDANNNFDNQRMNSFMVECRNDTIAAISFKGEAMSVHSTNDEINCAGNKVSSIQHIIYNLSRAECGMHVGRNPDRAVVKIRVQEGNIILGSDKKYSISCIFDKALSSGSHSSVGVSELDSSLFLEDPFDDGSFSKTGINAKACALTQKLEILGFIAPPSLKNELPNIDVITGDKNQVILNINTDFGPTFRHMTPVITDCIVASSILPSQFLWKFLTDGCGDGLVAAASEYFVNVEKQNYELRLKGRNILAAMGDITISCKISYCISGENCSLKCPGVNIFDYHKHLPSYMLESRPMIIKNTELNLDEAKKLVQDLSPSMTTQDKTNTTLYNTTIPRSTTTALTTTTTTTTTPTTTQPTTTTTTTPTTTSSPTPTLASTTEGSGRPSELDQLTSSDEQKKDTVYFVIIGLLSGALVLTLIVCISIIVRQSRRQDGSGRFNYGTIGTAPSWIRSKFWETGSMIRGGANKDPPY